MSEKKAVAEPTMVKKLKLKKTAARELPVNGPFNSGSAPCSPCGTCLKTNPTDY